MLYEGKIWKLGINRFHPTGFEHTIILVYELDYILRSRQHILRHIYLKICKINPIRARINLAYLDFIFNNVLRFLPTLTT